MIDKGTGARLPALKKASGFIRSQLAVSISHLRTFPQLRFHWDPVPERVDRMDESTSGQCRDSVVSHIDRHFQVPG